jgi:mannose-1-phosphate guanylyltransferase
MSIIHVILSGGVGSRLWPLSRKSRPKQYIPLFNNQSLFQLCALRNQSVCEQMVVVGNRGNRDISRQDLEQIKISNYSEITEAVPRNTAAAIAFAALNALPEDLLLVTPSDHVIGNQQAYELALQEAVALAKEGFLVTFGITPTRPETGYGYIHHQGNEVHSFVEKPDLEKAGQMLAAGNYLWNSGMFCFKAAVFLEELKKYAPIVATKSEMAWAQQKSGELPESASLEIPSISVDFAVMEHSDKIKVVPAKDLAWSDLGTFDSLWEYWEQQKQSIGISDHLVIDAKKPVFFIDDRQMIFVETEDAILVLPRDKSQEVKQLYEKLEKEQPRLVE